MSSEASAISLGSRSVHAKLTFAVNSAMLPLRDVSDAINTSASSSATSHCDRRGTIHTTASLIARDIPATTGVDAPDTSSSVLTVYELKACLTVTVADTDLAEAPARDRTSSDSTAPMPCRIHSPNRNAVEMLWLVPLSAIESTATVAVAHCTARQSAQTTLIATIGRVGSSIAKLNATVIAGDVTFVTAIDRPVPLPSSANRPYRGISCTDVFICVAVITIFQAAVVVGINRMLVAFIQAQSIADVASEAKTSPQAKTPGPPASFMACPNVINITPRASATSDAVRGYTAVRLTHDGDVARMKPTLIVGLDDGAAVGLDVGTEVGDRLGIEDGTGCGCEVG